MTFAVHEGSTKEQQRDFMAEVALLFLKDRLPFRILLTGLTREQRDDEAAYWSEIAEAFGRRTERMGILIKVLAIEERYGLPTIRSRP